MKVLGIDTATKVASVAVVKDGKLLAEGLSGDGARSEALGPGFANHAQTLVPLIDRVAKDAGLSLGDIEAIAVSIGPGSFTGLRIGLSTAKGLAYQGHLATVGVPTLAAMAARVSGWEDLICPVLDARKKEIYTALFVRRGEKLERLREDAVEAPDAMIEKVLIHATGRSCLFIGDAVTAYGARIQSALGVRAILTPGNSHPSTAAAIARLGAAKIAASGPDPIECLAPVYLRPCEAELQQR